MGYNRLSAMPAALAFFRPRDLPLAHALLDAVIAHEDGGLPDPRKIGAAEELDRILARLPWDDAMQLRAGLALLDWATVPRCGRRFRSAPLEVRRALLERWALSRVLPLRIASACLRQLVLLAYYTRPETWPVMGYDGPWLGRVAVEVAPVPRAKGSEGPLP